ncbi:hypothetical protein FJV76_32295 [Mesorhizobium sp. WSM4303]|uniref:hypothetical protein n=1 Tax=Mesorhizobium sp. WSM4306 TaxID=2589885 RepID=UPI00115EEE39|nr:hypothetical protein [Mesorhizobium sp. WSM4306]TRC92182.1 hypothetical protein FJV77_25885 [Mesorhizobium sp. WSM4306]TRC92813.1 hypothetical protein FJV76_32295 [Mesorhizobium sp. WSM4303]
MANDLNLSLIADSQADGQWQTSNDGLTQLANATTDAYSVDFSAGNVTLNSTQYRSAYTFKPSAALAAARTLTLPAVKRPFVFHNSDASYTVTLKSTNGASPETATTIAVLPGQIFFGYTSGASPGLYGAIMESATAGTSTEPSDRVRVATTANITISTALNNGDALDGVTLATGDLVLVKNQSSAAENGIYVVGASPARSSNYDTYDEHPGSLIAVEEGTTNADTLWLCTSNRGGTLNTTAINFSAPTTSGSSITAKDEGSTLTAAMTSIDFVGSGIVATNSGGAVTVTVASGPGTGSAGFALAGSWTYASDVAQVDFTGLGSYQEFVLIGTALTTSVSGFRAIRFSIDGGSTYYSTSGDYADITSAGVTTNNTAIGTHSTSATAARDIALRIFPNVSGAIKVAQNQQGLYSKFAASTSVVNAIRVFNTAGGNLTGGALYLYAR